MRVLIIGLVLSVSLSAQTIINGPVSTLNKVAWSTPDGSNVTEAQAFEARIFVDSTTTPLVLTGVTCTLNTLIDNSGGTWTYGPGQAPSIQIFRNGVQAAAAFGVKMGIVSGVLYLQGDDNLYYKWTGTTFTRTIATDPSNSAIDAAAVMKWGCQTPVSLVLMRLLNVRGIQHRMTLRLYDTVNKLESSDSSAFLITTPQFVTQPITVRIIQ